MILNFIKKNKIFFFIITLVVFFAFPLGSEAIELSPLRHTLTVDKGEKEIVSIFVTNDQEEQIIITPEVDGFTIDNKTGAAQFGQDDAAKKWITTKEERFELEPNETKEIVFRINVPENTPPGAHYLGLFAKQDADKGQVGIGSRVGTLLFLYVAGEIEESLYRKDFSTNKQLYFLPKFSISLQLQNNGNIHLIPEGQVILLDRKGNVIAQKNLNPEQQKVFPKNVWQQNYLFENISNKHIGELQSLVQIQYGNSEQKIMDSVSFWYIPKIFIIYGLTALGALIIILIFIFFIKLGDQNKK